ncbi:MAG: hypothetical protein EAX96_09755 [Candidatus Lokiarchaeota archaeon]|nr:hypothetical protein [Candidatus Lokiarchaeota archaeon]
MDLSPNVTRSLRAVDGALIVIDAVEEIKVQTESVLKMALKELVKPVLFINKIDRLINELKLDSIEIQKKLENIISNFNNLIEIYCANQFKEDWKINPILGNVGFGSAIFPNWGFTYNILKKNKITFNDIIKAYKKNEVDKIHNLIPLSICLLNLFTNHLPNPSNAQTYKLSSIIDLELNSKMNEFIKKCDENNPLILNVFNSVYDSHLNKYAIGRIYSGKIKKNRVIFNINIQKEQKIRNLSLFMGSKKIQVDEIPAGNIVAIGGLKEIKIGDTITDLESKDLMSQLKKIEYFSEPVMTVAIEPIHPQQLNEMIKFLMILNENDPNFELTIHKDSGEILVSGMGMLHLELICNDLKRNNIEAIISDPIIIYREMISKKSPICEAFFENNNFIRIKIEPNIQINKDTHYVVYKDKYNNTIENKSQRKLSQNFIEQIIKGIKIGLKAGPLCDEPIMNLKFIFLDYEFNTHIENFEEKLMLCAKRSLFGSFLLSKPMLYQPIYKIEIETSEENIGNITTILSKNKAKIDNIISRGYNSKVIAYISVKNSINFSKNLRNLTSGKSTWQMLFSHWEEIQEKDQSKIISNIRLNKGRKIEIPDPEVFVKVISKE